MRRVLPFLLSLPLLAIGFALTAPDARAMGHVPAFEENCASCHGAAGDADTPVGKAMKIPSFVGSELADMEPDAICEKVRGIDKHGSVLKKADEETLSAACMRVKELAAAGS
ncbi:MAG: hypothetical protein R3263_02730 [Myxococcota bacterium]|nr:hypothetical protein [Myxococcota bacterium]